MRKGKSDLKDQFHENHNLTPSLRVSQPVQKTGNRISVTRGVEIKLYCLEMS